MRHRTMSSLLVATLFLFSATLRPVHAIDPILAFLLNVVGSKLIDEIVIDPILGKPDTKKLADKLDRLIESDKTHAKEIAHLKSQLVLCATKEEVRQAMRDTLVKIDKRLAEYADRLYDLEVQQREIWKGLGVTQYKLMELNEETRRSFKAVDSKVSGLDDRMKDFEQRYTRWTPDKQALAMCEKGIQLYRQAKYEEAVSWFQNAQAVNETDAGICYYLALAYRASGRIERSNEIMALGVARERKHGEPSWFIDTLDMLSGKDREFINNVRCDPQLGVKVPGARGVSVPSGK